MLLKKKLRNKERTVRNLKYNTNKSLTERLEGKVGIYQEIEQQQKTKQ